MRSRQIDVTSKDIDGISDLVVWAPIKDGFIDAFNNVTYESRLRLVAEALHSLRKAAREHEELEPFADTAKRIISLLDFRIGVVDRDLRGPEAGQAPGEARTYRPQKYMYLVATFDGPWEPYIRLIYEPLGTFLDLVLCNCEGYKPARSNDFETYAEWVRSSQLDSAIFYSTSGMSVGDKIYFEDLDLIQRTKSAEAAADDISRLTFKTPDARAEAVRDDPANFREALSLGLEALNVLYKLTDLYPPTTNDGQYLHAATRDLLIGLPKLLATFEGMGGKLPETLKLPLDWYRDAPVQIPDETPNPELDLGEIQKGVLSPYDGGDVLVTHGALLLTRIDDARRFQAFLDLFPFSWENDDGPNTAPGPNGRLPFFLNIAFSMFGLEKLGVPKAEMSTFPKEFREGMAARAPLLGDKYANHPRRWTLPERFEGMTGSDISPPIELAEIDCLIQLRTEVEEDLKSQFVNASKAQDKFRDVLQELDVSRFKRAFGDEDPHSVADLRDELIEDVMAFLACDSGTEGLHDDFAFLVALIRGLGEIFGFTVLGIESMMRSDASAEASTDETCSVKTGNIDHFGFQDGLSQPVIIDGTHVPDESDHPMHVLRGDLLYGYANSRFDKHREDQTQRLMFNGSFLVVRKIKQNTKTFLELEAELAKQGLDASLLVGRTKDGDPLVAPGNTDNGFRYKSDPDGKACPLSAHIRLANPRDVVHKRPAPKIMRRGMSYGERVEPDAPDNGDRGIMFMAYCASLAEQYEVIQRWLNGANPTGVSASRNDPLTGALERTETEGHLFTVQTATGPRQVVIPEPLTKLEWGSYFFVPSRTALQRLAHVDSDDLFVRQRAETKSVRVNEGLQIIDEISDLPKRLQKQEWKKIIEDFLIKDPTEQDKTPRVWEAIDSLGGVYRVESGIAFDKGDSAESDQQVLLVTDKDLILKVLGEGKTYPKNAFSSATQFERINDDGFGTIYVCLDDNKTYYDEAEKTNDVLMRYSRRSAVTSGYQAATKVLKDLQASFPTKTFKLELGRQFIQPAMAELCKVWYGIPDGVFVQPGAWNWSDSAPAVCPGHFLATSRQTFYPRPTTMIQEYGKTHGRLMRDEGMKYIKSVWDQDPDTDPINGTLARHIHKIIREEDQKNPGNTDYYQSLLLRNIIGGMVGAIPPMDSCLRWALFDWMREETLWQYQSNYLEALAEVGASKPGSPQHQANMEDVAMATLESGLKTAMCVRPAPDLLYRTATRSGLEIGGLKTKKDDLVILCLSAATQAGLASGDNDVSVVFGGNRKTAAGAQDPQSGLHACPAKDLAMGAMTGMLAALVEFGPIKAMPASLIIEIG